MVTASGITATARRVYIAVRYADGTVRQLEFESDDLRLHMEMARGREEVSGDFDRWRAFQPEPYSTSVSLQIAKAETVEASRPPSWIPNGED